MRTEKIQLVKDLGALITSSDALYLVAYKGLDVDDFDDLRTELDKFGSECHVVPNRLFMRAAAECGLDSLAAYDLTGDTALVTGGEDAAAVAKALKAFGRDHDALSVKVGAMDGQRLEASDVAMLAELPNREVLLAQLLGVMQAPARNLAGVMYNRLASIVYVLNAYLHQQEDA